MNYIIFLLNEINSITQSVKSEKWDIECSSTYTCVSGNNNDENIPDNICFHPKNCLSSYRDWILSSTNTVLKTKANIIQDMNELINKNEYKNVVDILKAQYEIFLDTYITALGKFNSTIKEITTTIEKYTGKDGGIFSFVNCNFIGTNLKVILKYLKESLGGDLYTIGICLILVGYSLAFSISFTIFLIIVINANIDNKKKGLEKIIPFK